MDETTSQDAGAWLSSRLGNAIDILVDREINRPQEIVNSESYGIDVYGNVYRNGQPVATMGAPPQPGISKALLLLLIVGAFILAKG